MKQMSVKKSRSDSLVHLPLGQQLLFAAAKGNLHKVLQLLKQGATIAVNKHGRTALHISSHRGYLDIVRALLQSGCNPDIQDDNGDTALHRAVVMENLEVIQRLVEEGSDVDRQNNLGDTALHEAARCGFSNTIKLLLQSNANVYCRNKNQDIPLHMSSANGHCSCTMMLLHATSMHSPLNKQKDTPLHLAVRFGHFSCTRILLASNCDLNCQNEFGNTALHIATTSLHVKLVRILLDAHADATNFKNNDGKSPVDLAKDMNNGELVLMLLSGARRKRRGRNLSKTHRHRISHSESRTVGRRRSASEECHADISMKRPTERIPARRKSSHRNSMRKSFHKVIAKPAIEEHQKNLVVNPYVVPQLYSLYRDDKGLIRQVPVIDRLPNPTPQIVEQLHGSIERVRVGWQQSLQQIQESFNEKLEELRRETDYRLKSLDKLTLERLNAERTECLHRISRQVACERCIVENKALNELKVWVENRLQKLQKIADGTSNLNRKVHSELGFPGLQPSTSHYKGEMKERNLACGVEASYVVKGSSASAVSRSSIAGGECKLPNQLISSLPLNPQSFCVERLSCLSPVSCSSVLPCHWTPCNLDGINVSKYNARPKDQMCLQQNLKNNTLMCASCNDLTALDYFSQSTETPREKNMLQFKLRDCQTSYDCDPDVAIVDQLRDLTFGEVHAV